MKRFLLSFLVLLIVPGCAAPRAQKAAPSAPAQPEMDSAPTGTGEPPATTGTDKSAPQPTAPGGATGTVVVSPELQKAQSNFDAASSALAAAGNDCAQLCKALSSMTNATEHLCELAGEDKRCTDARSRLDAARAKVKSTCGSC